MKSYARFSGPGSGHPPPGVRELSLLPFFLAGKTETYLSVY